MKNQLYTLFILLTFCTSAAEAQILITSHGVTPFTCTPQKMLDISVFNQNINEVSIQITGTLTQDGKVLCTVTSESLLLSHGDSKLRGREILANYNFTELPAAQYIASSGKLLAGNYMYCIKITSPSSEMPAETCFPLMSAYSSFLQLISPSDRQVIEEFNPILTWTHSGILPTSHPRETFELLLSEKNEDQSAAQALAENALLLHVPKLGSHTTLYPLNAPKLKEGGQYAWQVIHKYDGNLIESSQTWWFEIREWEDPRDIKYIDITTSKRGDVVPVYHSFYFRFDEIYNSDKLEIRIIDSKQNIISPLVSNDLGEEGMTKKNGFNGYKLNLAPYNLKQGSYTVSIKNAKGQVYSIVIDYRK